MAVGKASYSLIAGLQIRLVWVLSPARMALTIGPEKSMGRAQPGATPENMGLAFSGCAALGVSVISIIVSFPMFQVS